MDKKLTFSDLYALGIGFTIGAGVFTLTGVAMNFTGGSTFLVYLLGAATIVFCMLPTIIAGSIVPRSGVSYSLSKEAFSSKAAGFYFWIFFIGRIMMAANATSFAMFFTSVFTSIDPKIVGAVVVVVFYIANYFGLKGAVKVQKFMNYTLFAAIILFIIMGVVKMNTGFIFNEDKFLSGGPVGFFNALSLLIFTLGGGMSVLELGGKVENPEKNLPKACLAVAATVAVLFAGIALATGGALAIAPLAKGGAKIPGTLFFKGPTQAVINAAGAIFTNKALLYFFIFGGACLAVTTTINSAFSWYSQACIRAAEDGWFPKFMAKENKYGTPYLIQFVFVLFGALPIFLVSDIGVLNMNLLKIAAGLQILCNVIPNLGLLALPRLYPDQWAKSKFKMNTFMLYAVTLIPTAATLAMVYFNFSTYPKEVLYPVLIICAFGLVYAFVGDALIKAKAAAVVKK
ncbi:MAG: APC family permease [Treponemataceae bacterium]